MTHSQPPRGTLAFDLDGTLAQTGPDILRAFNRALAEEGIDQAPPDRIPELVSLGRGPSVLVEHWMRAQDRDPEPATVRRLAERYVEIYRQDVVVESALYPACAHALGRLRAQGYALAVCTNKPEALARSVLAALGILPLFAAVLGRDSLPYCKPDPRHLVESIVAARGDPRWGIMVGDTATDVATARAAGIPVVCVSFGYSDVAPESLGADALIHDYSQLAGAVAEIEGRRHARASSDAGCLARSE